MDLQQTQPPSRNAATLASLAAANRVAGSSEPISGVPGYAYTRPCIHCLQRAACRARPTCLSAPDPARKGVTCPCLCRGFRSTPSRGKDSRRGRRNPQTGLSDEQMQEIREAFDLFDTDGSGRVDVRELKIAMRALGFDVKKSEVRAMVAEMASPDVETVNFDQFVLLMSAKMAARDSRHEILKVLGYSTVIALTQARTHTYTRTHAFSLPPSLSLSLSFFFSLSTHTHMHRSSGCLTMIVRARSASAT